MMDYRKLPKPDANGNYWFGRPGGDASGLIFLALAVPAWKGKWLALGPEGAVMDGREVATFDRPYDALMGLREERDMKAVAGAKAKGGIVLERVEEVPTLEEDEGP